MRMNHLREEKGVALILAILLLLVLTLIGISSVNTSNYDSAISGNERSSEQAFYIAEAGLNEFKGRFKQGVTGQIIDNYFYLTDLDNPAGLNWRLYLAINEQRAKEIGYNSNIPEHVFVQSLQSQLDSGVEVRHKVDSNNNVVVYGWKPVYIAKSHGFAKDGGRKVIEAEIKKGLDLNPPAALYSKAPVSIKSDSTTILGDDQCGTLDKTGIVTTSTITITGHPTIDTQEVSSSKILDLQSLVDDLKEYANYTYEYTSDITLANKNWGTPVFDPVTGLLTYTGELNTVYFNMNEINELTLSGDSYGAGILLVEGDLEIQGSLNWYGVVIVTGSFRSTGGSTTINVTGAVLAGDTSFNSVDVDILGQTDIYYCSEAIEWANDFLPFKIFRWREIF